MEKVEIKCPCGATSSAAHSNQGEMKRESGFFPFMNTRRGLETTWICPACNERVVEAGKVLADVFKDQTRYIWFSQLFMSVEGLP